MSQLSAKELEAQLHALFAEPIDDTTLRDRVTAFTANAHFDTLVPVWGPPLYRRHRVMFLPFILTHFQYFYYWGMPRWRGRCEEALEQWLAETDRLDDVELFQRLYRWKFHSSYWWPAVVWRQELVERFRMAPSARERAHVLVKYDLHYPLDEATARTLYEIDPVTAGLFISGRLQDDVRGFMDEAKRAGDDRLYWTLYRRSVTAKQWEADVLALCESVSDPGELTAELEKRHPDHFFSALRSGFVELARRRGADALPYLRNHLGHVGLYGSREYARLRDLAAARGWGEFHAYLVRTCGGPREYQKLVASVVADHASSDEDVIRKLYQVTGLTGTEPAQSLGEETAVAVYRRFPDLLRGPFRHLVYLPWGQEKRSLLAEALAANDELLIDHLAAQALPRCHPEPAIDQLADHYAALRDRPAEFARRAVSVLTRVPAYGLSDFGYRHLIRNSRLARLLLERSAELQLSEIGLLRDLLESPSIHVQLLALRILAQEDDRARESAAANLDLLLPMLLRRLHRRTRRMAFRALSNAATTEAVGRLLLGRAREAMELPDRDYPREQLIGLIGQLLSRYPALRQGREQPVVYARGTS